MPSPMRKTGGAQKKVAAARAMTRGKVKAEVQSEDDVAMESVTQEGTASECEEAEGELQVTQEDTAGEPGEDDVIEVQDDVIEIQSDENCAESLQHDESNEPSVVVMDDDADGVPENEPLQSEDVNEGEDVADAETDAVNVDSQVPEDEVTEQEAEEEQVMEDEKEESVETKQSEDTKDDSEVDKGGEKPAAVAMETSEETDCKIEEPDASADQVQSTPTEAVESSEGVAESTVSDATKDVNGGDKSVIVLDEDDDEQGEFCIVDEVSGDDAPETQNKETKSDKSKKSETPEERKLRKESYGLLGSRQRFLLEVQRLATSALVAVDKITAEDLYKEDMKDIVTKVVNLNVKVKESSEPSGYIEMTFHSADEAQVMQKQLKTIFEEEQVHYANPTDPTSYRGMIHRINHKLGSDPDRAILVYGLEDDILEEDLLATFPKAKSALIPFDWKENKRRRFAFVEFSKTQDVGDAFKHRYYTIKEHKVRVIEIISQPMADQVVVKCKKVLEKETGERALGGSQFRYIEQLERMAIYYTQWADEAELGNNPEETKTQLKQHQEALKKILDDDEKRIEERMRLEKEAQKKREAEREEKLKARAEGSKDEKGGDDKTKSRRSRDRSSDRRSGRHGSRSGSRHRDRRPDKRHSDYDRAYGGKARRRSPPRRYSGSDHNRSYDRHRQGGYMGGNKGGPNNAMGSYHTFSGLPNMNQMQNQLQNMQHAMGMSQFNMGGFDMGAGQSMMGMGSGGGFSYSGGYSGQSGSGSREGGVSPTPNALNLLMGLTKMLKGNSGGGVKGSGYGYHNQGGYGRGGMM